MLQTQDPCFSPPQRPSRRRVLRAAVATAAALPSLSWLSVRPLSAAQPGARAPLAANLDGGFDFETELLQGTIEPQGAYHGVTRLIDKRSGRQVIDERYSALNLFKLLSVNAFHGEPRSMQRTVTSGPDWVEIQWPTTEMYQGEVTARYEVIEPASIELTVRIRTLGNYPVHELFMSSYFDKTLKPYVSLQPVPGVQPSQPQFVVPMVNDLFRGTLPVFPRDAHAARHCIDGRWDRSEHGTPVVQMCPLRRYGHCLAFVTDPEETLAVVLMSQPSDCYAISARYFADQEADRLTSYSAFDMSLFGADFLPGDERKVRVRLALTPLDAERSQPLKHYQSLLAERAPEGM